MSCRGEGFLTPPHCTHPQPRPGGQSAITTLCSSGRREGGLSLKQTPPFSPFSPPRNPYLVRDLGSSFPNACDLTLEWEQTHNNLQARLVSFLGPSLTVQMSFHERMGTGRRSKGSEGEGEKKRQANNAGGWAADVKSSDD